MAFYESPRFPERIAFGAEGGPQWRTVVVITTSGAESRNADWAYPRHRWDVSTGIKSQEDFEKVRAHFMSVRGRLHGFRFKDWSDYTAQATGDLRGAVQGITTTTFQLVKRYASGAQFVNRLIRKPIAQGFQLFDNTTLLTLTTDYTINTTTGIVTTVVPRTAANLSWSGEFDVPCRYDTDELRGAIVSRNNTDGFLHQWSEIPVMEIPA
jgi:uncharacterized protein (TIGR02217 family)